MARSEPETLLEEAAAAEEAAAKAAAPAAMGEGETHAAYIARLKERIEQAQVELAAAEQAAAEQAAAEQAAAEQAAAEQAATAAEDHRGSESKDASSEEESSDEATSEEENSDAEGASRDNDYASSSGCRRSPAKAGGVATAGETASKKKKAPPRRRLPYTAELGAHTTKDLKGNDGAAMEGSIDLRHLEKLVGPARKLAKLYSMAMNEGATPAERAHAQAKMDRMVAQGSDDVLKAFAELRDSNRKCSSERVSLCRIDIYRDGVRAKKRPSWMIRLAWGVAKQFMVKVSTTLRPFTLAFHGDEMGAAAAASLFVDLVGEVCHLATCESWAEGFACGYFEVQVNIKAKSQLNRATSKSTALVVAEQKDLADKAEAAFFRKNAKGRPSPRFKRRNPCAFSEGKAAGSEHAVSKTAKFA